ncbi:MAG: Helicase PriA essential for oriC/DnaA-independent DNA replication [Parcubacteria group bacterium GW2011_GWA1_44_13]|nr:MAG: Helicase PriA essential for oriC/DnaA-independent DNA replication [Parcubacteria group bacterium GW2011_GWA1_44_13]
MNEAEQYLLEVVPLVTIPRPEAQILSYYCDHDPDINSLITVPFRNRSIPGLVLASTPVAQAKRMLKKDFSFSLKHTGKVISPTPVITLAQQNLAFWLASKYHAPLGPCFKNFLPNFIGKKKYPINLLPGTETKLTEPKKTFIPLTDTASHYKNYLSIIKKHPGQSVLLLVPETTHLDYFAQSYTTLKPEILHSGLNNQKIYDLQQKISAGQPTFVIATRLALTLPWQKLGLIIVDSESNPAYYSDTTPKYFAPDLARQLAKLHSAELIISDTLPRVETAYELDLSNWKLENGNWKIVDMVSEIKDANYSPFSTELKEQIQTSIAEKKKLVIFVPRKGYAPYLLCKKCGETVRCKNCDHTLVVHRNESGIKNQELNLICHHCENTEPITAVCPKCKGGILEYKGLGIQKAMEKLKVWLDRQNITAPPMLELSNDSATTRAEADKIINEFRANPSTILFTTQKIFSYLYLIKPDLIAILNADLLANFANWRADEEALHDLLTLTKMSEQTIIQSYHVDSTPIKTLAEGGVDQFIKNELANRQSLNYPPFCEIIKLVYRHRDPRKTLQEARIVAEKIKNEVAKQKLTISVLGPVTGLREKGLFTQEIILKIKNAASAEATAGQRKERSNLLRLVGSQWRVSLD